MLFLPIVDRELRIGARNWRTYWSRVSTGTGALGLAFYLIWMVRETMGGGGMAGIFILKVTSYMTWALCVFAGINRTCDSLSSEKRADTLGLLFLTHLKGYDIVLGKLIASSLSAVFLLIGVMPILSIPVLLGGVSGTELVRLPIALLNSLLLAQGIGLLVSSLVRTQRVASAGSAFIMVFLAVFLPLLAQWVEHEIPSQNFALMLRVFSPIYAQEMSFALATGLTTNYFWTAILVQFALAVGALVATCLIIPHTWKIPAHTEGWHQKFERWTHGTALARRERRTKLLARNPFYWLSCRDRFAPVWPLVFALAIPGVTGWCIYYYEIPQASACVLLPAAIAVNDLTTRMRVANVASARLAEDRQSGALEMVLSTPVKLNEIVKGQWMAVRHIQLPAYLTTFLLYIALMTAFLLFVEPTGAALAVACFFAFLSMSDFIVVGYVAMWKGMRVSNPRHAAGSALFRVLLVPFFVWMALMPIIHEINALREFFDRNEPYAFLGTTLLIWCPSSIMALIRARRNLRLHFREAATDRYLFEQKFSLLARLRRPLRRLAVKPAFAGKIIRSEFAPPRAK